MGAGLGTVMGAGLGTVMGAGLGTGAGCGGTGGAGGRTAHADSRRHNSQGLARIHITGEDEPGKIRVRASITMDTRGLGWLLLEAGIALGLFVFIVWWTMKK